MLEPNEQVTKIGPPVLPSVGISEGGHLAEDLEIAKKMKQKSRNEAHLTAGCGYTSKKALLLDTFWGEMWPELQKIGWQKLDGVDENEGSIKFFPPNPDGKELAVLDKEGRRGKDYYDRIMDIIERVQTRRNSDEKKAADRFTKAQDAQQTKRRSSRANAGNGKKRQRTNTSTATSTGSVSSEDAPIINLRRRQPSMVKPTIDLSWKVGGTLYPKQTSRIGNEFQAVSIPVAGSYTEGAHADLYEVIYDPLNRHAASVIQALSEVPVNIKEQALTKFGLMATESANEAVFPNVSSVVSQLTPSDGSDWTSAQKETFHREIFRLRKDLTALSKLMGKDLKTCVTYYLSTFKKSDDYRILKVICAEERMDESGENGSGVDSCAVCGDGGSLIICDGCEGEYHMECLRPRLRTVPEGHWECDECVDRKLLKAQESLLSKTRLFECRVANIQGEVLGMSNGAGDKSFSRDPNMRPSSPVVAAFKAFAAGLEAIFTAAAYTGLDSDGDVHVKIEDVHPRVEHVPGLEAVNDVAVLSRLENNGRYSVKTEDIEPPVEHTAGVQAVVEAATTTKLDNNDDFEVKSQEIKPPTDHADGLKAVFDAVAVSGLHDDGDDLVKRDDIEPPIEHTARVKAVLEATALTRLETTAM